MKISLRHSFYLLSALLLFSYSGNSETNANAHLPVSTDHSFTRTSSGIDSLVEQIQRENEFAEQKIRAIYIYIGRNITYDMRLLDLPLDHKTNLQVAEETFRSGRAICKGYAALFDLMCKQCGIQSFIIPGYVKLDGKIMDVPHAWNAAFINNKWKLFDPTWGAGYIDKNTFVPKFTYNYFEISPEESIKSRMPFDPMWQLLDKPITHQEFIWGIKPEHQIPMFSFNDSIQIFLASDTLTRLASESNRVKEAGLLNSQINTYYNYLLDFQANLLSNKEIDKKNAIIMQTNKVVDLYNLSVKYYNEYINSKNTQFLKPKKTDDEVRHMISEPDVELLQAETILKELHSDDPEVKNIIIELLKGISEIRTAIDQEKIFVEKYCKTAKALRINLFRIPIKSTKKH
jgi:hypothetical protein